MKNIMGRSSLFFKLNFVLWLSNAILAISVQVDTVKSSRSPASIGLVGDPVDVSSTSVGVTALLGGSTDVDEAFQWMIKKSGGGDFVVLRASGTDAYNDYIYELGSINSVETLLITSRELANDPDVERTILNAEALFIAGGDQANYVNYWKNSKVHHAIDYLRNVKQVPVGGTSAGCAILGGTYFGALEGTITSPEALSNPYTSLLTLGYNDFLNQPYLSDVVTDSHFDNRDRHGRLTTFLARMSQDNGMLARGIGLDESTAVCIEPNGIGRVFGSGDAYFLSQTDIRGTPERCTNGTSLDWYRSQQAVRVYKIRATTDGSHIFDLSTWGHGTGGTHQFYYVRDGVLYKSAF